MSILERLDPQQRAEAWSMLNIMLHTRHNLTPLVLSFAVEATPEDAIDMRVKFLDTSELEDRQENIKRRLRALGNLLELHKGLVVRVMHLTLREFLLRADVQRKLTSNIAISALDTNVALLSTCLTMIKSLKCSDIRWDHLQRHTRLEVNQVRRHLVRDAVYYAVVTG